jgi:DNA-binding XRE family transcriptional regulator/predicted RNase H-like HicB family nuclease
MRINPDAMMYSALLQRTEEGLVLEFPELPGLSARITDPEAAASVAHEVLNNRIQAMLEQGEVPTRPGTVPSTDGSGHGRLKVPLRPDNAVALQMRWIRQEQGLTLTKVAQRMGVSRQRISALETTARNWTVATLLRLSEALDADLEIVLRRRR